MTSRASRTDSKRSGLFLSFFGVTCAALLLAGCGGGGGGSNGDAADPTTATFDVRDGSGTAVTGATVYLVPAAEIDQSPISGADILSGAAENRDEPLEDAVRLRGFNFPQAVTDANGRAVIRAVPANDYFWFVQPSATDSEHLPGGDESRRSRSTANFLGLLSNVTVSSKPSATATYLGSSTCLVCHTDEATQKTHLHRLGFSRPGNLGTLQDISRYPDIAAGWAKFIATSAFTNGTKVYFFGFDATRGFDKFKTSLTAPTGGTPTQVIAYLWQDTADQKYKITLQNMVNVNDPLSPRTLEVPLTYGGGLYKQRNLVKIPGRKGLFPFLQLQSEGAEPRYDRTRKVYRDYHLDWFWNSTTNLFTDPPLNTNFEAQCTGCHSTGFSRFLDNGTGTWLSDAVDDASGEYDIDQNGTPDEINTGCEACHGPGSDHVAWASNTQNAGRQARYIVNPARLSPERSTQICGRCHDRPVGNGPVANEEPLNPQGLMAPPGISRADFLAQYTTRKGPASTDFWSDDVHSKSHHQQYADFIKSTMYRNDRILTTCVDCHDSHGRGQYDHHTIYDQGIVNSYLCQRCHAIDPNGHMLEKTGQTHGGNSTLCIDCHMPKTAKTGAGKYGIVLGLPTGTVSDDGITYFENDIASHRFLVPHRTNPSVAGQVPATAMPIPFTKSCGALCHDASTLQQSGTPTSLGSGSSAQSAGSGEAAHEPDDGRPATEQR